jgi:hypothetical protein
MLERFKETCFRRSAVGAINISPGHEPGEKGVSKPVSPGRGDRIGWSASPLLPPLPGLVRINRETPGLRRGAIFSRAWGAFCTVIVQSHRVLRRFLISHESRTEDNQDSKDHFCGPLNKRNDTKISCILSCFLECFVGKPSATPLFKPRLSATGRIRRGELRFKRYWDRDCCGALALDVLRLK